MANLVPIAYADNEAGSPSWLGAGGSNTVTNDATQFVTGSKSCKQVVSTTSATYLEMASADAFPVLPGAVYYLSWWFRSTVTRNWDASIQWYDSAGSFISQSRAATINAGTTWTQGAITVQAPSNAVKARVSTVGSGTISDIYIDDIRFDFAGNYIPVPYAENERFIGAAQLQFH